MDVIEKNLMDAQEFNKKTKSWTLNVRKISRSILRTKTSSSDALAGTLGFSLRYDKEKIWVSALGFTFNRYGAFREYGAGRGYVVVNGVIRRGERLWNAKNKSFRNKDIAASYYSKGDSLKELKKRKIVPADQESIWRKPLSWLDKPITDNIQALANIVGEFYGDEALRHVLNQLNKITIKKKYGKE